MTTSNWQIQQPFSAVIFDVDGTLSAMEGIDWLAEQNGAGEQVRALTEEAMGKIGINHLLYQQRLELVKPRQAQMEALGREYIRYCVQDSKAVIAIFQRLDKAVYLVSAGMYPAVCMLGASLNIPADMIYAVNIQFDQNGRYKDFDQHSLLVNNDGKRIIAEKLQKRHQTVIHTGDGLNDFSSHDVVTRFVGYGGVYYRKNLEEKCEYYVRTLSHSALLPLALTAEEAAQLLPGEKEIYQKGLHAIESGKVKV